MDESVYRYKDNNGNVDKINFLNDEDNRPLDEPDYINRHEVDLHGTSAIKFRASGMDLVFTFIAMSTYLADHVSDILISRKLYINSQWRWFVLVVVFLVLPSIILQIISFLWNVDDDGDDRKCCHWFSFILHIFQLGPIERLSKTFYYGMKTVCCAGKNSRKKSYKNYLKNWRDISMLRFLESFLETAPQVIIQLYIILQYYSHALAENWFNFLSVGISIVSLSWSIVTYTYVSKLCNEQSLSIYGYIFQGLYRISIISSRIMTIIVFSLEYTWVTPIVLFLHWILMVCWLRNVSTPFCLGADGNCRYTLEYLYACLMGFVYIFCFINTKEGATRGRITFIYVFFLVENSVLAAAWLVAQNTIGVFESAMIFMVWGTFFIGIISMVLYYQFFHPNINSSVGWCHCCSSSSMTFDESGEQFQTANLIKTNIKSKVKVEVEFPSRYPNKTVESIDNISAQHPHFPMDEPSSSSLSKRDIDDNNTHKVLVRSSDKFNYDFSGFKTDFL